MYEEDSLPAEVPQEVIRLGKEYDLVFDPKSIFTEKLDVRLPKEIEGIKVAYLIFTLPARKLQKITLESQTSNKGAKIYGEWQDKDKTIRKKYPITTTTTKIDMTTISGQNFFAMCCANPFVYGSLYQGETTYFKLEIPELRAHNEMNKFENVEDALVYVSKLKDVELDDLAVLLSLEGFRGLSPVEKRTMIKRIAIENPDRIVNIKNNIDSQIILDIKKAIEAKVIVHKNNIYKMGDEQMGISLEQAVGWCKQNEELFQLVKDQTEEKLNIKRKK